MVAEVTGNIYFRKMFGFADSSCTFFLLRLLCILKSLKFKKCLGGVEVLAEQNKHATLKFPLMSVGLSIAKDIQEGFQFHASANLCRLSKTLYLHISKCYGFLCS